MGPTGNGQAFRVCKVVHQDKEQIKGKTYVGRHMGKALCGRTFRCFVMMNDAGMETARDIRSKGDLAFCCAFTHIPSENEWFNYGCIR